IRAVDQNGNVLPFFNEPAQLKAEGDIAIIGPACISLKGGLGGTYVKSLGRDGKGSLTVQSLQTKACVLSFTVSTDKGCSTGKKQEFKKEGYENEIDR
ncbi:MAG: hypothetical protein ACI4AB_00115, partial [Acetatifactor sp.]